MNAPTPATETLRPVTHTQPHINATQARLAAAAAPTAPSATNPVIYTHTIKNGEFLSQLADSPAAAKAREEVRTALTTLFTTKPTEQTVNGILTLAMAEGMGITNMNQVKAGQTITLHKEDIDAVVKRLKDNLKLDTQGRLTGIRSGEANLASILPPLPAPVQRVAQFRQ